MYVNVDGLSQWPFSSVENMAVPFYIHKSFQITKCADLYGKKNSILQRICGYIVQYECGYILRFEGLSLGLQFSTLPVYSSVPCTFILNSPLQYLSPPEKVKHTQNTLEHTPCKNIQKTQISWHNKPSKTTQKSHKPEQILQTHWHVYSSLSVSSCVLCTCLYTDLIIFLSAHKRAPPSLPLPFPFRAPVIMSL